MAGNSTEAAGSSNQQETANYWMVYEMLSHLLHEINVVSHAIQHDTSELGGAMGSILYQDAHVQDAMKTLQLDLSHLHALCQSMAKIFRVSAHRIYVERQELMEGLEALDALTVPAATRFYQSRDLEHIATNICFVYGSGFAAPRTLQWAFVDLFQGRAAPFLDFYERTFYGKDPHYEEAIAIATLVLTAIGAIVAPFLAALYSEKLRKKAEVARGRLGLLEQGEVITLLDYLLTAYALREAWAKGQITFDLFARGRSTVRLNLIRKQAGIPARVSFEGRGISPSERKKLESITSRWFAKHHIEVNDALVSELVREVEAELRRRRSVPRLDVPAEARGWPVIRGMGASSGTAFGRVCVVGDLSCVDSIPPGCVGTFYRWEPEMVKAVIRCSATIGAGQTGGYTGHLAVVSRTLGIPSVVAVDKCEIKDGTQVFVDGDSGTLLVEPTHG